MNCLNLIEKSWRFPGLWGRSGRTLRASRQTRLIPEVLQARIVLSGASMALLPALPTGPATTISNDGSDAKPVSKKEFHVDPATIYNSNVNGVAFQIDWRDIEPKPPSAKNQPKWNRIDEVLKTANEYGKWVQLLIFPGFWSAQ